MFIFIKYAKELTIKTGNPEIGYTDSYVIFDDVFIPWERVFLCGEYLHGGALAMLFALFHRHSYSGCKPAIGDMLLGLASLAARHNGISKAHSCQRNTLQDYYDYRVGLRGRIYRFGKK